MKLTDENQDYMDCQPLRTDTGIKTPERIQKLIVARKAEIERARQAAAEPDAPALVINPTRKIDMDSSPAHTRWNRLSEAAAFALAIHADQIRKGANTPYIAHLLGVASLVLEHGGDQEQAIAGLLHDAIEDQGAHQEAIIAERFGDRVARIVRACTDTDSLPKPPWRERKEAYIAHLEHVDRDALLVSCADKVYNARAICTDLRTHGLAVYDRFTGGKAGTIWYYGALSETFSRLLPGPLSAELAESVREMRQRSEATPAA